MSLPSLLLAFVGLSGVCADVEIDRAQLLDGVKNVERPGAPGVVAVFGDDAFVVLTGGKTKSPLPVVAAARHGKGRVAAFTHNGYISAGVLERKGSDAARLVTNTVKWLGPEKRAVLRVGLLGKNDGLKRALEQRGHIVTSGARAFELVKYDVAIATGGLGSSKSDLKAVQAFVAQGGGFLAALCPWGYEQVNSRRGLTVRDDLAENRVLRPFGIAFTTLIANANENGGYGVKLSRPDAAHAGRALAVIEEGKRVGAHDVNLVVQALRSLPKDDTTFLPRVKNVIGTLSPKDAPRPGRPLGAGRPRARLAVAWMSDTWRDLDVEKVQAAPGSEFFPGAPEATSKVASVNDQKLQLNASVRGLQNTGLYLPAGTVLSIVGETMASGWRVQIGCHTDRLWHKERWLRWPEITHRVPLEAAQIRVATPFGGTVYFEATREDAAPLDVRLSGAIAAPRYVLGDADSAQAWGTARRAPGPWAELEGRHMVLSVPSAVIRELDDPAPIIAFWDSVLASHCKLAGTPLPARRERFVPDAQISAGYMHSGYPIMCQLDTVTPPKTGGLPPMLDLPTLQKKGNWGFFHELGHNRQKRWWTFEGTTEVTCNLFSLHAGDQLCGITPWNNPWLEGQKLRANAYLKSGAKFADWKRQPGTALMMYAQVQRAFGWDPIHKALASYETTPAAELPKSNQDRIDTWMRRLSLAVGHDLRSFFDRWGLPLSASTRKDKALDALEPWLPDFDELAPAPENK